jgi:hypothetical protein
MTLPPFARAERSSPFGDSLAERPVDLVEPVKQPIESRTTPFGLIGGHTPDGVVRDHARVHTGGRHGRTHGIICLSGTTAD